MDNIDFNRRKSIIYKANILGIQVEDFGWALKLIEGNKQKFIDLTHSDSKMSIEYDNITIVDNFVIAQNYDKGRHCGVYVRGKDKDIISRIKNTQLIGAIDNDTKVVCIRNNNRTDRITLINYKGKVIKVDVSSTRAHSFKAMQDGTYVITETSHLYYMDGTVSRYESPLVVVDADLNIITNNDNR